MKSSVLAPVFMAAALQAGAEESKLHLADITPSIALSDVGDLSTSYQFNRRDANGTTISHRAVTFPSLGVVCEWRHPPFIVIAPGGEPPVIKGECVLNTIKPEAWNISNSAVRADYHVLHKPGTFITQLARVISPNGRMIANALTWDLKKNEVCLSADEAMPVSPARFRITHRIDNGCYPADKFHDTYQGLLNKFEPTI